MSSKPLIAIVGSGAVGSYYGGRLAQHGHDVHFLARSDYAAIKQAGLVVRSCDGDFAIPASSVQVYDDPTRMPKADLVIVALKTTSNDQFARLISPLLKEDTAILTLQNGLGNEDELAELYGAPRILGGMAFVCINRISPGVIDHQAEGLIAIGEFTGPASPRLRQFAAMFESSKVRCRMLDDLRYGRWEKLVWNIPFNGLSAAMDMTTDHLVRTPHAEVLARSIMAEVVAAATGCGVHLPPEMIDAKIRQTQAMGPYKTSMHLDMQSGRPMEIEAIFGAPLRAAQKAGIPVPRIEMLYRLLKLREAFRTLSDH